MRFAERIEAAIVDLDGTLLDTAPDIAEAANRMLLELSLPARDRAEVADFIGQGLRVLVARCIGSAKAPESGAVDRALAVFERHYSAVSGSGTRVFPGAREGLVAMRALGIRLACITNKAEKFTLPLMERFDLGGEFDLVVSGDMLARKKPDPLPLQFVCGQFGVAPAAALMIGDSPNDTLAARAAGCPVACVPYGYREGREVRDLDCDAIVSTLAAAASLIQASNSLHRRSRSDDTQSS
jgi:phosphoglycolate phosphatase